MFLPTTKKEMKSRNWDQCDVVVVTPDAYIDHPAFAAAVLGRMLESNGYRVGIISQPKWKDPQSFLELGIPKIAFAVSGGAMDSMVMNYTASKIPRSDDAYCEKGEAFFSQKGDAKKYRIRPDRTINVYASQIRSVCRDVPIIIGGIEASMRRIAHYDWWSDSVQKAFSLIQKRTFSSMAWANTLLSTVSRHSLRVKRRTPWRFRDSRHPTFNRRDP